MGRLREFILVDIPCFFDDYGGIFLSGMLGGIVGTAVVRCVLHLL